jgi:outer membrane protein OmpA-like peptidoglycan-associated protein
MKKFLFFAQVGIFLTFITLPALSSASHQLGGEEPNYVVIGAFAYHKNAIKFTREASTVHHLAAKFEMNPNRKLYYVYVLTTVDRNQAIEEAKRLRSETKYADTWVYSGALGETINNQVKSVDIHPITEKKLDNVETHDDAVSVVSPVLADKLKSEESRTQEQKNEEQKVDDTRQAMASTKQSDTSLDEGIVAKPFFFKLYRATDNEPVKGDVEVIDVDRSRKMGSYQGNTLVRIVSPGNRSGNIGFVCEVFGYRKVQKNLNFNLPEGEEFSKDESGNIVVPFELVRLQKGDIAVMYNVYFFKDAGVMRPESRYEVESLLEMLKENPNYKIKIHGHTNGGAAGKIISMGPSKNFFSLTDTREGVGSAKKLSNERAEVIREYLISNGIDAARMQIKAWGGKRPIHDKHHTRAAENVRVEIEILED